jgi:hypothetical protein
MPRVRTFWNGFYYFKLFLKRFLFVLFSQAW